MMAERGVTRSVRRTTLVGLVVNIALAGVKGLVGHLFHSQALIADGVHSLSDTFTDVAVLIGVNYWGAPADDDHPYGHGRIEIVVSLVIGVLLAFVGALLVFRAVRTLPDPHGTMPGMPAFWVACLSIVAKEVLYRWTTGVGRQLRSSSLIANAWHHRSDALSSIPVALAVLGARFFPDLLFLDHIAAVLISALILKAAWKIAWPALCQLVDAGADHEVRERILAVAEQVTGVLAVHALRTRDVGRGLHVDLHVLVDPEMSVRDGHEITNEVRRRLLDQGPNVVDVLVHLEPYGEGIEATQYSDLMR